MSTVDLRGMFDNFWANSVAGTWDTVQKVLLFIAMFVAILGVAQWITSLKGQSSSGIDLGLGGSGGQNNFKQLWFFAAVIAVIAVIPNILIGGFLAIGCYQYVC